VSGMGGAGGSRTRVAALLAAWPAYGVSPCVRRAFQLALGRTPDGYPPRA
jgi:hypothetical protein